MASGGFGRGNRWVWTAAGGDRGAASCFSSVFDCGSESCGFFCSSALVCLLGLTEVKPPNSIFFYYKKWVKTMPNFKSLNHSVKTPSRKQH